MKKLFFAALILILGFAPHVLAEGFTALAPIPGLTDPSVTSVVNAASLSTFLNSLYKYLVGLAAAIAVVQIIWAGLDIAFFHKDAVSTITDDKGKIYNAVFGLILVLSPVLVFSIINPSILNLTLNLPAIETLTTSTALGGGTGAGQQWCYFRSIVAGEGDSICSPTEQACNAGRTADEKLYATVTPCSMSAATAPSTCSVSGTAGILQFADCPSTAAATAWGQNNCSGGVLSAITTTQTSRTASGTETSINRISCTQSNVFDFIDVSTSNISYSSFVNRLQPVAITTLIPNNPNNGASAVQYAAICQSVGWNTCMDKDPATSSSHTCVPSPTGTLPVRGPTHSDNGRDVANCYTETLTCEKSISSNLSGKCSSSPSWTPFN